MNADKLELKCVGCRKVHREKPQYCNQFESFAYGHMVEWSDFTIDVPRLDENIWMRSDRIPIVGEERMIKVTSPFCFTIGEHFNVFFSPSLSAINGWDSYPNQICQSAIVTCEFKSIIIKDDFFAWITVRIVKVEELVQISSIIAKKDSKFLFINKSFRDEWYLKYDRFILCDMSLEGDLGAWYLLEIIDGEYHQILFGDWDCTHDFVYIDNQVLNKADVQEFLMNAQEINPQT